MASGLFVPTWINILEADHSPAIDFNAATHRIALFNTSLTLPNFSTATAYGASPFNANEISSSGTNYTTGGPTVSAGTVDESPTGSIRYVISNVSWAASTIPNANYALIYADNTTTPIADPAIVFIDFGNLGAGGYSTSSGTFTIQWASGGVFAIDLTPA